MKDTDVIQHIEDAIANMPAMAGITFVRENTHFDPTLREPWCRGTFLPSEPTPISIGEDRQLRIVANYQLDCYFPASTATLQPLVDQVIEYFNDKSNRFPQINGEVLTIEYAWRLNSLVETDWVNTPVRLRVIYYRN